MKGEQKEMGWTGIFNAIRKANGTIDRKATLEREFSGWTSGDKITRMIKSGMSGSTFYAAMETSSEAGREVWALVVLTSINGGEFCYKEMDETEGPYYYDCPKGILDALTPTTSATANEWRQKCREAREKKKAAAGRIPRNAARLYITFLVDTSASKAGDSVTVERVRDQWIYVDKTGNRWRLCTAHLRNEDFIRIDKAETAEEVARNDAEEAARKAQEAPEPIKVEETTTAPTERQEEPQNGPTKPEKLQRYVFRTFTGWTVYDGITSETIIEAATDEEAEEKARTLAAGRAYSVNRLWTAEQDAPETLIEAPTTDASPAADTETTSTANEPQSATETPTETTTDTTRPESIQPHHHERKPHKRPNSPTEARHGGSRTNYHRKSQKPTTGKIQSVTNHSTQTTNERSRSG